MYCILEASNKIKLKKMTETRISGTGINFKSFGKKVSDFIDISPILQQVW